MVRGALEASVKCGIGTVPAAIKVATPKRKTVGPSSGNVRTMRTEVVYSISLREAYTTRVVGIL